MSHDPNEMMLDLFRAEVESHADSLTGGLLKLEQDPTDTGLLDGMMRAAHSIKGAARIVRVDAAVDVAHVMEDCFVAAQRGELVLQPTGIDLLLRSVDLLGQVAEATKRPTVDWDSFKPAIKSTVSQLRNVLNGQPIVEAENASQSLPETPLPSGTQFRADEPPQAEHSPLAQLAESVLPVELPANRIVIPAILNQDNAESMRTRLLAALELPAQHVTLVIDLSLTHELDAVGLALLHSLTKYAAKRNSSLRFERASATLVRILTTVGIGPLASVPDVGNGG